jgi:hypothetical protein
MDDPTRRCENDTGNETHSPGLPIPSGGPIFVSKDYPCDPLRTLAILHTRAVAHKKDRSTCHAIHLVPDIADLLPVN